MSVYRRYHTVTTASQDLFHPDCPVYVSRYCLLTDIETGDRLLQVRLVNLSEKIVRGVFVCVRCLDAAEQPLATLELVPVTGQNAAPGQRFGEDKLLTLWPRRTVYAEILPQRVEFADGTAWNSEGALDFFAITPAKPVRIEDPAYPRLTEAALRRGVRNDFYFAAQRGVWRCTCGTPNSAKALRCACCGAERSWLEQNMDPSAVAVPPKRETPDPVLSLPKLLHTPVPVRPITPEPLVSEELLRPYSAPVVPEPEPEETEPVQPPPRRWVPWLLAGLFTLLLVGLAVGFWLLAPYLQYLQGVKAQNEGDYERALAIFSELDGARDSAERIIEVRKSQASELMQKGDFTAALEELRELPDTGDLIADCLYSLGVLACNEGDPSKGLDYAAQLQKEFPDYDKQTDLDNNCNYRLACSYLDKALSLSGVENAEAGMELLRSAGTLFSDMQDFKDSRTMLSECQYHIGELTMMRGDYESARQMFEELGEYKNCGEMALECDYQLALQSLNSGNLYDARNRFEQLGDYSDSPDQVCECDYRMAQQDEEAGLITDAVEQYGRLGGYRDSSNRRDLLMLQYVAEHYYDEKADAQLLYDYVDELLSRNVSGAQELVDMLVAQAVSVRVNLFEDGIDMPSLITVSSLDVPIYIHYRLRLREPDAPTHILVQYTLPDGSSGTAPLNPDGSLEGSVEWAKLVPKQCETAGNIFLNFTYADATDDPFLAQIIFSYDPSLAQTGKDGSIVIPEGMSVYVPEGSDGDDGKPVIYAAEVSVQNILLYNTNSNGLSSGSIFFSSASDGPGVSVGTSVIGMDGEQTATDGDGNVVIRFGTDGG